MDIHVHRWINSTTKKTYIFGKNKDIDICIFNDDTIIKAINKIAVGIHSVDSSVSLNSIPFLWFGNKNNNSLRFNLDTTIKNPFIDTIKQPKPNVNIIYKNDELFNLTNVNIVFLSDLINEKIDTNTINALFPEKKTKWNYDSYKIIKDESARLYNLWLLGKIDVPENYTIHRINLISKVAFDKNISTIFHNTKCNSKVQFMQLIEDSSHILYKLYKEHNIPVTKLTNWTSYSYIPKTQTGISILNAMFYIKDDLFAQVMLDSNGQIYVRFKYESSNQSELTFIKQYCTNNIEKWLIAILQIPVKLQDDSYFLKTTIPVSINISSKDYGKLLSKENLIFNLVSADKDILNIDYLRSKSHNKTEIIDYIRARAKLGISLQDIKLELLEKQLTEADINLWFEQYISELQALEQQIVNPEAPKPRKKKTISLGCTLRVQTKKYEIIVSLDNVSSINEADSICRWIRGTIYNYLQNAPKQKVVEHTKEEADKAEEAVPPKKQRKLESSSSTDKETNPKPKTASEERDFDIDVSDGGSVGGAGGKELHGFLIKALKKADPKVFDGPDNYSEQCQANNFRQPVVLTKEEKANIDKLKYTDNADGYIEYGSDPANKNFYTCPRIWCPISKIPLTIEELNKLNGKCPGPHFEEPIHMYKDNYWRKSPDTAHHVGFLANINQDKLCMPCCGKKPIKQEKLKQCNLYANGKPEPGIEPKPEDKVASPEGKGKGDANGETDGEPEKPKRGRKKKTSDKDSKNSDKSKQETYIFDKVGVLDPTRYGLIPQDLHTFLYPKTPYSDCSKSISTTECIVRKGQGHVDDYLLESVAYASGFKNKESFIKEIQNVIDPLIFIGLDNGNLFTAFMEDYVGVLKTNKTEIYNEWKSYLNKHATYQKQLNLTSRDISDITNIKVSRELVVFKSLKNFIKYLKSNVPKNPQHLFDLLHRMGILLALWHRNSTTSASLVCPSYTNLNTLAYVSKQYQKVAMVLEDNTEYFYEPLEMKVRSKDGVSLFPVSGRIGSSVKDLLLHSCKYSDTTKGTSTPLIENIFVEMIRSLEVWAKLQFAPSSSPFMFKTVLLRADGKLYGFLTHNNLLITCPNENINIVPLLFKICKNLKFVSYIEDVSGNVLDISFMATQDFILYISKIATYGFGIESGNISQEFSTLNTGPVGLRGSITLPTIPHGMFIPLVPIVNTNSELLKYQTTHTKTNTKWYQLQKAISSELLKYYETLVVPLLRETKKTRINTLLAQWKKLPKTDLDKVQVILETLPLESKENLAQYIRTIGSDAKSLLYLSSEVHDMNKDWVFSQVAVEDGLPHNIYISNKQFIPHDYNPEVAKQTSDMVKVTHVKETSPKIPSLINVTTGSLKSLPKKWTKGWLHFKVLHQSIKSYTRESLPELFNWIYETIYGRAPFYTWTKDIESIRNHKLQKIYNSAKNAEEILDIDSSLFHAWNIYLGKKYKTPSDMVKSSYNIIKTDWLKVVQLHNDLVYPMDTDLDTCAQMLNISILVLFRTKYGTTKDIEEQYKRGDIEDLVTSANLFTGGTNDYLERPCIILYREKEPKVPFITYSVLVNVSDKVNSTALINKCLYTSVNEIPEDIVRLISVLRST